MNLFSRYAAAMTMTDALEELFDFLRKTTVLWVGVFALVCLISVVLAVGALYNKAKLGWDSYYFVLLCLAIFFWAVTSALPYLLPGTPLAAFFYPLRLMGLYFMPALLCLDVWKQVSYKEVTWLTALLLLLVPCGLCLLLGAQMVVPQLAFPSFFETKYTWAEVIFALYGVAALVKSYLLCFNVFYQMPRHMRRSAYYMLAALTIIGVATILELMFQNQLVYLIFLFALVLMLLNLYNTFSAAPSANVIVTSRDFVFGNLSTLILVLSRKMNILDWNKKGANSTAPLPQPKYRESFDSYKARMIKETGGRISPHDASIISIMADGQEQQYLLSLREVNSKKRKFGFLAEISEITSVYSVMRYFEEIAVLDRLTGLYNRNAYMMMVPNMLVPELMPLAVIVGDVNNLKRINDTHGHLTGDMLLSAVAGYIHTSVPVGSVSARIGGDEFVILLPGGTEAQCERFVNEVQAKCEADTGQEYGVPSVSWGFAIMQSVEEEYNAVFAHADAIMYASKKSHLTFRSSGLMPTMQETDEHTAFTIPLANKQPADGNQAGGQLADETHAGGQPGAQDTGISSAAALFPDSEATAAPVSSGMLDDTMLDRPSARVVYQPGAAGMAQGMGTSQVDSAGAAEITPAEAGDAAGQAAGAKTAPGVADSKDTGTAYGSTLDHIGKAMLPDAATQSGEAQSNVPVAQEKEDAPAPDTARKQEKADTPAPGTQDKQMAATAQEKTDAAGGAKPAPAQTVLPTKPMDKATFLESLRREATPGAGTVMADTATNPEAVTSPDTMAAPPDAAATDSTLTPNSNTQKPQDGPWVYPGPKEE